VDRVKRRRPESGDQVRETASPNEVRRASPVPGAWAWRDPVSHAGARDRRSVAASRVTKRLLITKEVAWSSLD
jgi:hypothetical protein